MHKQLGTLHGVYDVIIFNIVPLTVQFVAFPTSIMPISNRSQTRCTSCAWSSSVTHQQWCYDTKLWVAVKVQEHFADTDFVEMCDGIWTMIHSHVVMYQLVSLSSYNWWSGMYTLLKLSDMVLQGSHYLFQFSNPMSQLLFLLVIFRSRSARLFSNFTYPNMSIVLSESRYSLNNLHDTCLALSTMPSKQISLTAFYILWLKQNIDYIAMCCLE